MKGAGGRGRRSGRRSGVTTTTTSRDVTPPPGSRIHGRQILRDFLEGWTLWELSEATGRAVFEVEAVIRKAAAMSKKATARKVAAKAKKAEGRVKPTPPKKKAKTQVKTTAWRESFQD